MRTVSYRIGDLNKATIHIGRVAENEYTRVQIDAGEIYADYPHAAASLTVQPPEGDAYPAAVSRDGDLVIWDVPDSALTAEGEGEIQLTFTENGVVVKSAIGRISVCRSIIGEGEAPDPLEDFLAEAGAALTAIPETIDAALEEAKESGEFDGPQGPAGADGAPGPAGRDGYTPVKGVDYFDGEPGPAGKDGKDGAAGADGHSPVITGSKSGKVTTIYSDGVQIAQINDGADGQGGDVIDDTTPALDKTYSSSKIEEMDSDVKSALNVLEPSASASDVGKYLKAKTVSDGKVTEYEFGEGGTQITVDSELSDSSINPVQNKVITGVVNKLGQPKLSQNIYNGEMWSVNGYFQDSGNFVADNGYRTTAPVYLEAGNYMFNVRKASVGSAALKVFVVNSTGETVQSVVQGTDSGLMFNEETNIVTFTLSNACYTRYNMASSRYASSFMIVKGSDASTYPTNYVPYVEGDLELKSTLGLTEQMVTEVEALKLKGKKLSVNGDSICYGEGYTGGYAKIIGDTYGMTVQNVAVSGGTITAETYSGSSERHWISRTITSMASDADYAIIEGGVNDAALTASIQLGSLTNDFSSTLDDTTYLGALESTLKQLTTRFAGKKYGFIIVHKASTNFSNMGSDNGNWYWATRKALEKWGVPYLDLNVACPPFGLCSQQYSPDLYALAQTYTKNGDGWHPNEEGYKKYYVPKIVAWMNTL